MSDGEEGDGDGDGDADADDEDPEAPDVGLPEHERLTLPSTTGHIIGELADLERDLREGQSADALRGVRLGLAERARLYRTTPPPPGISPATPPGSARCGRRPPEPTVGLFRASRRLPPRARAIDAPSRALPRSRAPRSLSQRVARAAAAARPHHPSDSL
ncbi:hypothetical protein K525DRAFT_274323 [Schizophyllum commune Loenen D]|nr:hypothetical protein K525DRAFT_274323 [Schizophyllum commune Loenen D]